jgi:hypothetical protein
LVDKKTCPTAFPAFLSVVAAGREKMVVTRDVWR